MTSKILAVTLMARPEGGLLDPVYCINGLAGLIDLCRRVPIRFASRIQFAL